MADLLEKNVGMQKRNAQRLNLIIADYLSVCEQSATDTRNEYRKLPKTMQTETVIASAEYWDHVAKGLRWSRERLKVKPVGFYGPQSSRDHQSEPAATE